jgi:hypothetical protein
MWLQALAGPCKATEGFGTATTMGEAVGVLGFDFQRLHASSLGWKDIDHMNVKFLPHPDRQCEEDVDGADHLDPPFLPDSATPSDWI